MAFFSRAFALALYSAIVRWRRVPPGNKSIDLSPWACAGAAGRWYFRSIRVARGCADRQSRSARRYVRLIFYGHAFRVPDRRSSTCAVLPVHGSARPRNCRRPTWCQRSPSWPTPVVRSTSVPTDERLPSPLIRSPSQCPGIRGPQFLESGCGCFACPLSDRADRCRDCAVCEPGCGVVSRRSARA